jgi:hypothetical protein
MCVYERRVIARQAPLFSFSLSISTNNLPHIHTQPAPTHPPHPLNHTNTHTHIHPPTHPPTHTHPHPHPHTNTISIMPSSAYSTLSLVIVTSCRTQFSRSSPSPSAPARECKSCFCAGGHCPSRLRRSSSSCARAGDLSLETH